MDVNDFLYDELSSFISTPNEYNVNHHDFDEIISSTMSPTLDFSTLISQDQSNVLQSDNFFSDLFPVTSSPNEIGLNFDNLSTLSAQSLSLDNPFAPPESLNNSFNSYNSYGDNKFICNDLLGNTQNRNTPSPTDSCGSFSGSSTSGVQSDTSEAFNNGSQDHHFAATPFDTKQFPMASVQKCRKKDNDELQENMNSPALTMSAVLNNHKIKDQEHNNSSNLIFGTSKVPIVASGCIPKEIKKGDLGQPTEETLGEKPAIKHQADASNKTKTIFLSSKDYKALMLKMNSNNSRGATINGSVQTQMPKIIIKTGNEKVQSNQHVQATRIGHTQSMSSLYKPATLSHNTAIKNPQSVMNICRGKLDEKMYKKQQRMIKNRESASLSRKKKKDYVFSLETRINDLQKENHSLKEENLTLHKQLLAFAKTCRCNKGSNTEFVLHSLSSNSRLEQQVKIGSKSSAKSLKQRMNAATIKKNVAVLFAMAFMVTLNAGNFQSYLNKQNIDANSFDVVSDSNVKEPVSSFGRRLLWVESEEEYNEKLNISNRPLPELAIPPLHFLQHTNQQNNASNNKHLNSTAPSSFDKGNTPPPLTYPSSPKCKGLCAASIPRENQANYSRLGISLQKLINVSGYRNLNMEPKVDMEEESGFKFQTDYLELPVIDKQAPKLGKRKTLAGFNERFSNISQKQSKLETENYTNNTLSNTTKAFQLFKKINRRDDTLYIMSFNANHIILSPSTQNQNVRPKISLLLPSANPSQNGDMMMMQVDCEVFNTKELQLKSNMIPSGAGSNMGKWQTKHASNVNRNVEKIPDRPVKPEKPLIRTYFMVGPKNQAAAALSEEKPQLVAFNKSTVNSINVMSANLDDRLYS